MAKYKKGDIVKVVDKDSPYYGEILIVNQDNDSAPYCLDANRKFRCYILQNQLELATGYDAIVKGTVLKRKGSTSTQKVLGIVGDVYVLSRASNHEECGGGYARKEIENHFEAPTEPKGTPVYDKDQNLIGYMTDGKVITN